MTEILTESFCERCGTRYTFESNAPRRSRIGRVKVLSKGVRNFVMSDESSFSEAMADARSEEELAATAHQLDAFHRTFNFCLSCRQYTCGSCWNSDDGRCLSCAPDPTLVAAAAVVEAAFETEAIPVGEVAATDAWPELAVSAARLAEVVGAPTSPDAAVPVSAEAPEAESQPGAVAPSMDETQPETESVARAGTAIAATAAIVGADADAARGQAAESEAHATESEAAAPTADAPSAPTVQGLAPGQSLDEAIAAWEAQQGAGEPVLVEAAAEPEAEPVEAAAEAEPVEAAAEAEPEPTPRVDDVVPQPTWPVAATPAQRPAPTAPTAPPAPPAPPAPAPWLTVAPDDGLPAEPQWPAAPLWPTSGTRRDGPTTLAGRPLLPHGDATALWAASAREVLSAAPAALPAAAAAPTAQPCVGCGLSLSANARFCRRCGARQT